jgi:ribonuclease Z
MKLQFIGTGSGKTSLKRDHSSILIDSEISKILVDCGDGISRSLLKNKIDFNSIDVIIFTHYHPDHFSGIASLINQMKMSKRKNRLTIFTHKNLVRPLKTFIDSCYLFEETFEFDFEISHFEFDDEYPIDNNFRFTPKQNSHIYNKHNISRISDEQFVSASLMFGLGDKKIIYSSDIGKKEDLFLFENVKSIIYITETTHFDLDWLHGIALFYHPEKIYLTHISDADEQKIT